jgi:hypothetical protein
LAANAGLQTAWPASFVPCKLCHHGVAGHAAEPWSVSRLKPMRRQPFNPNYSGSPLQIGASLIEQIPRLAELVGRIAINWSGVEAQLSLALGSMLGVENAAAVALFVSLRNHRAQRDALAAVADITLAAEDREIFEAVLLRFDELNRSRNNVVHGIWGTSAATPDGIIWTSQQSYADSHIRDYHTSSTGQLTHESRVENMTRGLFVVRLADLSELNTNIMALDRTVGSFNAYIRYRDGSAGKHAYEALQADPVVQEKRRLIRENRKTGG